MKNEELHSWAISQGATHYMRELSLPAASPSSTAGLSALLEDGEFLSLRLAGCLLFHPEVDVDALLGGLSQNACKSLAHIVACGKVVEQTNPLWNKLEKQVGAQFLEDAPHWSRFCTQAKEGYAYMGQHFVWLRPNKRGFDSLMKTNAYSSWA